jgi:hypothetical protein
MNTREYKLPFYALAPGTTFIGYPELKTVKMDNTVVEISAPDASSKNIPVLGHIIWFAESQNIFKQLRFGVAGLESGRLRRWDSLRCCGITQAILAGPLDCF